jgi:hypothetical protein
MDYFFYAFAFASLIVALVELQKRRRSKLNSRRHLDYSDYTPPTDITNE